MEWFLVSSLRTLFGSSDWRGTWASTCHTRMPALWWTCWWTSPPRYSTSPIRPSGPTWKSSSESATGCLKFPALVAKLVELVDFFTKHSMRLWDRIRPSSLFNLFYGNNMSCQVLFGCIRHRCDISKKESMLFIFFNSLILAISWARENVLVTEKIILGFICGYLSLIF